MKVNVNVAARCSSSHDVLVLLVLLCEDTRWPPDVDVVCLRMPTIFSGRAGSLQMRR